MESKKQNKKNRNKLMDTEIRLNAANGDRGVGVWVKTVKGFRGTNGQLQTSHGDVKYNIEK